MIKDINAFFSAIKHLSIGVFLFASLAGCMALAGFLIASGGGAGLGISLAIATGVIGIVAIPAACNKFYKSFKSFKAAFGFDEKVAINKSTPASSDKTLPKTSTKVVNNALNTPTASYDPPPPYQAKPYQAKIISSSTSGFATFLNKITVGFNHFFSCSSDKQPSDQPSQPSSDQRSASPK